MAEPTDRELDEALERGQTLRDVQTRAQRVRYDRHMERIVIDLTSGCSFLFPPRLVEGLAEATDKQLEDVEILGAGYGLHWEALDVDVSVPGLLSGVFGRKAHMTRLEQSMKAA